MKYFTFSELTRSVQATLLGIDNTPTTKDKQCLRELVDNVLDPLREKWGSPIIVTSGYRCKKLNDKIKGASKTSSHMYGQAADIMDISKSAACNKKLLKLLLGMGLEFDQVICEYPDKSGCPSWIHVSYRKGNNRGQKLTKHYNTKGYTSGIKL